VSKARFITPSGPFDDPISHFKVALQTVATALSVVVLVLLMTVPHATHAIKIELWDGQDWPDSVDNRPVHVLVIRADGTMTFSGAPVANLRALRELVDLDQQAVPVPMLRVEPDPQVRYADFLEALAEIKRANVYQYCVDFDPQRRLTTEFRCARRPVMFD
jgi:biopolymer transport protein ExbD